MAEVTFENLEAFDWLLEHSLLKVVYFLDGSVLPNDLLQQAEFLRIVCPQGFDPGREVIEGTEQHPRDGTLIRSLTLSGPRSNAFDSWWPRA